MSDLLSSIRVNAIGIVRSNFKKPTSARLDLKKITSEIEIDPRLMKRWMVWKDFLTLLFSTGCMSRL